MSLRERLGVLDLRPEDCRKRALQCVLKAQLATSPSIRSMFAELAQHWAGIADDLENLERLRDDWRRELGWGSINHNATV
jgi:hypothetical protein